MRIVPIMSNPNQSYMAAMPASAMLNVARNNPYNDKPLEFKTKTPISPQNSGLLDLDERENQLRFLDSNFSNQRQQQQSHDSSDNMSKSFGQNDALFRGGLGPLQPPTGLLMMPNVMNMMHDPTAMLGMQSLPQFTPFNTLSSPEEDTNTAESTTTLSSTAPTGTELSPNLLTVPNDTIVYKSCILIPPPLNAPVPSLRPRPSGCRTVFVGGLPENITEDIIREIFAHCGEITTLRMSKKNFCHVRFNLESSVDMALCFSGYRIRIDGKMDSPNNSRIHVDFANARDDQYEWECKQRQFQREQRHRERIESRNRSLSPANTHFTDLEAASVTEQLKSEDSSVAIDTLITWLERGDCNKKNANTFYSMIQCTIGHVRRLIIEKPLVDEELRRAQELFNKKMAIIYAQSKFYSLGPNFKCYVE